MLTNADCTLYNQIADARTRSIHWRRTELRGVMWQDERHVNVKDRELLSADSVWVCIPADVACGGVYARPDEFAADPDGRWTLRTGDALARGIVPGGEPPRCDSRRDIVSVIEYSDHWEVTGA